MYVTKSILALSVLRYQDKISSKFLEKWIKDNLPLPSKEKSITFLKKHIKSEEDLDIPYNAMNDIINFIKSKKAKKVDAANYFPLNFVKNLAVLLAIFSILGGIASKEHSLKELTEKKIIEIEPSRSVNKKEYLGKAIFEKDILEKINKTYSIENMNVLLLEAVKKRSLEHTVGLEFKKIDKVKHPLELKFTLDRDGKISLLPDKLLNIKENTPLYVYREYSSEDLERIEKNLKDLKKERNEKN